MLCSICGKPITGNKTKDHIFPREIAKWSGSEHVREVIESRENIAPAHKECNFAKQDLIPNLEDVFITEKQKQMLRIKIASIEKERRAHETAKADLIRKQENRCFCCGRVLKQERILRRIDPKQERFWDNACIVCRECNDRCAEFI